MTDNRDSAERPAVIHVRPKATPRPRIRYGGGGRPPGWSGVGGLLRPLPQATTVCGAEPTTVDFSWREATSKNGRMWLAENSGCPACIAKTEAVAR